ncbi:amino acid ABC transporter permease [Nakamurella antarctica]|uniref:Amino acid ABC transporter permease n=1 Tax=Nakamurella antarctica TaxID=1902245 RepID=A0A3G8ZUP3_9ACTN|nr:amino acid ABC transporter permease [Nakamurella antarctica]AZI57441.1 amino acid ABC transporter permease [Nakamurella antarctica]
MALTRRQKLRVTRLVQGLIGLAVIAVIVTVADWQAFAKSFLNWDVARGMFPRVITTALINTLLYTACSFMFGLVLAIVLALMRLSSFMPYRALAMAYVELFRGLPALVVLFLIAYGIPIAFAGFTLPGGLLGSVTVGLGLTAAAYMSETLRAGIQAVPKGQVEAARTLGMSSGRTLVTIVLPQAFRIVIPPLTNEMILLVKDSSLVYVLGLTLKEYELTKLGQTVLTSQASATPLLVIAILYLVLTLPLSQLVRRLEIKHARAR